MPTPMDRAPSPDIPWQAIPKQRYTSPEFAEQEWRHLWSKVWLLAGHESELRVHGDYITFDIGPESILITRQADGHLKAAHNVCMHRGNRLCNSGNGHEQRFFCKFHGWQYALDGTLRRAHDAERFPMGTPGTEFNLKPVTCETWCGFIFISLNPHVESLQEYLGIIPEHLGPYGFEHWKIDTFLTIEIDCNWKTSVDAFNEVYHLAATHTWTLPFSDDVNTTYDCYDKHTRMIMPEITASPRHSAAGTVSKEAKELFLARAGIDITNFDGDIHAARGAFANAIRSTADFTGADFSDLNEQQMCDDFHYTLFPNVTFNIHSAFTWVFLHRPHPTDPNKMYFDFFNLVNAPKLDVEKPQRKHFTATPDFRVGDIAVQYALLDEDLYNLPRIQQGMKSSAFESLYLNEQEIRILHFHHTLMKYLES